MKLVEDPGRVRDLSRQIAGGTLTSEALVERCLSRIAAVDGAVHAWIHVLADQARGHARLLDAETKAGKNRGPLHGLPVAVKDVIDVAGIQTRANSQSRADVEPAAADATVVTHLRAAGAIILGKVHTTEYAYFQSIPPTRNPHDLSRTPGGSSAGSGAAIASGTVPLALGTQTAGSVNRPAAYTGVGAFKPSTLSIAGAGIVPFAPTFDTVGAFGATAQDAAYLAAGFAPDHLRFAGVANSKPRRIVVLEDTMIAQRSAPAVAAQIEALAAQLANAGIPITPRKSSVSLEEIVTTHRRVMLAELGRTHGRLPRDKIAPRLAEDIAAGLAITDHDYHAALRQLALLRHRFWDAHEAGEILLMPAAPDVAPADGTTGDPSFVIPTTALGGPVATVRAGFASDTRMPVGALLFAAPGADGVVASLLMSELGTSLDL